MMNYQETCLIIYEDTHVQEYETVIKDAFSCGSYPDPRIGARQNTKNNEF